jgi:hypothetical protein
MKQIMWTVPDAWPGQTVVILGGGPSLSQAQVDRVAAAQVRGACKVIAINNAYQIAPWAELLYFCDEKWWTWHKDRAGYRSFTGRKVTLENPRLCQTEPAVHALRNYGWGPGLCEIRDGVYTGRNGGYQAINLAVHLGARRIVLLGFDMRAVRGRTQWHDEHPVKDPVDVYQVQMMPCFETLPPALERRGVEVLNASPGSALEVFPKVDLSQVFDVAHAA